MNITHESTASTMVENEFESDIINDVIATQQHQSNSSKSDTKISKQFFKLVDNVTPNYVLGYN